MRFNKLSAEIKSDIFSTMCAEDLCTNVAPVCREWRQLVYNSTSWTKLTLCAETQSVTQMITILKRSSRLRKLTIANAADCSWIKSIPINNSLRELSLSRCGTTSDAASHLVSVFPNVEVFSDNTNYPTDVVVREIIRWKYLKSIVLYSPNIDSNNCLNMIANNCQNLCCLHARYFEDVDDRSFINFINQRGPQLRELFIGGLGNLTSISYQSLTQCKHLTFLSIHETRNLSDFDYFNFRELSCLENLRVGGSDTMFTSGLFAELFCKNSIFSVEYISMLHCGHLKYNDLNILLNSFKPKLREIIVSITDNLTSADCDKVAENHGFMSEPVRMGRIFYTTLKRKIEL